MHALLLATILLSATPAIEDGSLLILQHSNKPVAAFTGSELTHVAVILNHGSSPWVYEATPAKVRRVPLSTYTTEIAELNSRRRKQTRVQLLRPKTSYTEAETERLKSYLTHQIGRRYSIKGYVRDRQGEGIHCAEFASSALLSTQRFRFAERPYAITPAELFQQVKAQHLPPESLAIRAARLQGSWCSRAWVRWTAFQSWCGWACYESWMFCR